jgi:hypothetical protein
VGCSWLNGCRFFIDRHRPKTFGFHGSVESELDMALKTIGWSS